MNKKMQKRKCIAYEINIPGEGTLYKFFPMDTVDANGGVDKLEECLTRECNWFRQLGYVSEEVRGHERVLAVSEIKELVAKPTKPVQLGHRHPCFGASTEELRLYDTIQDAVIQTIKEDEGTEKGVRYFHALKELKIDRKQISEILEAVRSQDAVEYLIDYEINKLCEYPNGDIYEQECLARVIVRIRLENGGTETMFRAEIVPIPTELDAQVANQVGAA